MSDAEACRRHRIRKLQFSAVEGWAESSKPNVSLATLSSEQDGITHSAAIVPTN
jgi:hypothetical protein